MTNKTFYAIHNGEIKKFYCKGARTVYLRKHPDAVAVASSTRSVQLFNGHLSGSTLYADVPQDQRLAVAIEADIETAVGT